jgi:uncharacterized small protein (DUF1192 family)
MDWEETRPKKKAAYELGADLSAFSVKELEECLDMLAAERQRIEAALAGKKASRQAAHSVFKS